MAKIDTKKEYSVGTGRRRSAVARVRLYSGKQSVMWGDTEVKKGEILVNGKKAEDYFPGEVAKKTYLEPLRIANLLAKAIVTIKVAGGGPNGQLDAAVHGIARALNALDRELHRGPLKKQGLLTRDARTRQRRSVGMGGKSRRKKQSPKR